MTKTKGKARGLANARCKLTDDDVDTIRELYEQDRFKPRSLRYWSAPRLAEKFDLNVRYVKRIVCYEVRLAPTGDHD